MAALEAAAADVLADKGYEATTMTEIAARAGASIGSLYQYFPTKEDIAAHLHAAYLDQLDAALSDVDPAPIAGLIDAIFEALGSFLKAHPALATLVNRRDIDPARKLASRTALEERLGKMLAASGALPAPQIAGLAVLLLQQIKIAVMLTASGRPEDIAAIRHLKTMLHRELDALAGEAGRR
ncbi:helix-turn-helix domain-containing protein [Sphingomonas sp. BIUV-7]|uniref:Helix-turn-helix domain-containing protein n=1 Tax=Sphingomonas natans TaxID=3063330 RepID=A0ABT8Y8V4_9SPHN|nr:TetR/AcrR family transcriptional regulator [Sphingomonas sp. BIUV-7]MDO6414283.1 helix-turn-helix domain-containing protein [Sphingomonas sp. BIUV-7]